MNTLIPIMLGNTAVATLLAALALIVSRSGRRPALAHGLWVLVLVKLLTPPIVDVPLVELPQWKATVGEPIPRTDPAVEGEVLSEGAAFTVWSAQEQEPTLARAFYEEPRFLEHSLLLAWSLGALWILLLSAIRAVRFATLLRRAEPTPRGVLHTYRELCREMGLLRAPDLLVVDAKLSPMLFGAPSARIVLPATLLRQLDPEGVQTLLTHELAHFCRRDHWVRILELLATALLWWHPLTWLARRELREVEEQSCDAWVLQVLPRRGKVYATALLDTVDYLAEEALLPPAASGASGAGNLKRRVTMIMEGNTRSRLGNKGRVGMAALAMAALPVLPIAGQESGKASDSKPKQATQDPQEKGTKQVDTTITYGVYDEDTGRVVAIPKQKPVLIEADTRWDDKAGAWSVQTQGVKPGDEDLKAAVKSLKKANKNLQKAIERLERKLDAQSRVIVPVDRNITDYIYLREGHTAITPEGVPIYIVPKSKKAKPKNDQKTETDRKGYFILPGSKQTTEVQRYVVPGEGYRLKSLVPGQYRVEAIPRKGVTMHRAWVDAEGRVLRLDVTERDTDGHITPLEYSTRGIPLPHTKVEQFKKAKEKAKPKDKSKKRKPGTLLN